MQPRNRGGRHFYRVIFPKVTALFRSFSVSRQERTNAPPGKHKCAITRLCSPAPKYFPVQLRRKSGWDELWLVAYVFSCLTMFFAVQQLPQEVQQAHGE